MFAGLTIITLVDVVLKKNENTSGFAYNMEVADTSQ